MALSLEKELQQYGYDGDPDEVRETIGETHGQHFPDWTDETLADHLDDAKDFCRTVRRKLKTDLPDELIMRTLRNMRKADDEAHYSPSKATGASAKGNGRS